MIMNSKNAVVTGIIKTDKGNVSFFGEDFKFNECRYEGRNCYRC